MEREGCIQGRRPWAGGTASSRKTCMQRERDRERSGSKEELAQAGAEADEAGPVSLRKEREVGSPGGLGLGVILRMALLRDNSLVIKSPV